jgi:hypothetical protein
MTYYVIYYRGTEIVIDEVVDEPEEEPEVYVWIVVTHVCLIR